IIKERSQIGTHFEQAGWVTLLLNVLTMLVGYITAKALKIRNSQARSIAIESGIQNGTLAITIAVVLLNNTAFAIAPAIYSILMFFTGGLFIFIGNRQAKTEIS
ncbi:MAG: bile acid:sodium symporter family protein, partial [Flavobacteriaceae bacterium]|nr:bile acid:sodium symporter family protein [Flavobacteriaceae bacterium]